MIKHVLKDGTEVPDVAGMVVKPEDLPVIYEVISRIQMEGGDLNAAVQTSK